MQSRWHGVTAPVLEKFPDDIVVSAEWCRLRSYSLLNVSQESLHFQLFVFSKPFSYVT